ESPVLGTERPAGTGAARRAGGEAAMTPLEPSAAAMFPPADLEVSVVIPCLNEQTTIGTCVAKAKRAIAALGTSGEVLVVDNGSSDASAATAEAAGGGVRRGGSPRYRENHPAGVCP